MKTLVPIAAAGALVALTGAAFADTAVSATTDLNVRAGPGSQYPVIGVLRAGQQATLSDCLQNGKWCTIAEADGQGWVYSDYVTGDFGGTRVVLSQRRLIPALPSSKPRRSRPAMPAPSPAVPRAPLPAPSSAALSAPRLAERLAS